MRPRHFFELSITTPLIIIGINEEIRCSYKLFNGLSSVDAPILYTFRRCPYAIRARMALTYSKIQVEQCEVGLKNKPQEMLLASPKGTVPVLILENGLVIDESIDIMVWALTQFDPDNWLSIGEKEKWHELIRLNDLKFKPILDNYKYPQKSEKKIRFIIERKPRNISIN
ncbi:hypothetical protein lpari_03101 [Legionella parisiensis]|uniref:GST N-terminal domain-containing protein n=1 Tax=Legionella parisiensis TaxID=45071 RepID=A0A1E5JNI9_9GAMM|nr:glutathione S-transferase N-terminal domain-containing protein [Legionella parisiensis]OEH45913.1 hypothetical protein lpari_03101 [Legionella parisiensis]